MYAIGRSNEGVIPRRLLRRIFLPGSGHVWSASPYVGCHHFEIRSKGVPPSEPIPKPNAAELLSRELREGQVPASGRILIGAHCDPFPVMEERLGITHGMLAAAAGHPGGVTVWTRREAAAQTIADSEVEPSRLRISVGLSTLDRALAASYEDGASAPLERLRLIAEVAARGHSVELMVAPILPGINDGPANLRNVIEAGAAAGAIAYTRLLPDLDAGGVEWTMPNVRALQPFMNPRKARRYQGDWDPSDFTRQVCRFIDETAGVAGLALGSLGLLRGDRAGQLGLSLV